MPIRNLICVMRRNIPLNKWIDLLIKEIVTFAESRAMATDIPTWTESCVGVPEDARGTWNQLKVKTNVHKANFKINKTLLTKQGTILINYKPKLHSTAWGKQLLPMPIFLHHISSLLPYHEYHCIRVRRWNFRHYRSVYNAEIFDAINCDKRKSWASFNKFERLKLLRVWNFQCLAWIWKLPFSCALTFFVKMDWMSFRFFYL